MANSTRRGVLRRVALGSAGAGIAALAGCAGDGGDGTTTTSGGGGGGDTTTTGTTVGSVQSDLELVIGCPTSLSGPFAPNGEAERDGGMLAARHLEEDLGVTVDIVTADTELNPSTAVQRLERMVVSDGAVGAFGGVSSAVGLAMGSWANDNAVPFLPHGTSNDITGSGCGRYMFSTYMSNSMQVRPVAPLMADAADDWFIIYSDYTWGQTANESFVSALEENGATVVESQAAPFPADDYTPYLNAAAESDADGLALLVAGLDQRLSSSQILDLGLEDQFTIMMHQNEDVNSWGLSKEGAAILDITSQGWTPALDVPDEWLSEIIDLSEHDPYVRHYIGYASVDQLVRAAVRADSTDADEIVDELSGHEVSSERLRAIQPSDNMYWREGDHQLIQPVYATKGRAIEDMVDTPSKVWFEIIDSMQGDEASPEPSAECSLSG